MDVNDNNLAYLEAIHNFVEVSAGGAQALGTGAGLLSGDAGTLSSPSPGQRGRLGLSLATPISFCLYAASYVPLRLSLTMRLCSFLSLCLSLSPAAII